MPSIVFNPATPVADCSFCGVKLFAYGATHALKNGSDLLCCRRCATQILPTIQADAMRVNELNPPDARRYMKDIQTTFWQALSARLGAKHD